MRSWNQLVFPCIWSLMKSLEVSWSLMKSHEVSWSLVKSLEVPWSLMKSLKVAWSLVKSAAVLWNPLKPFEVFLSLLKIWSPSYWSLVKSFEVFWSLEVRCFPLGPLCICRFCKPIYVVFDWLDKHTDDTKSYSFKIRNCFEIFSTGCPKSPWEKFM